MWKSSLRANLCSNTRLQEQKIRLYNKAKQYFSCTLEKDSKISRENIFCVLGRAKKRANVFKRKANRITKQERNFLSKFYCAITTTCASWNVSDNSKLIKIWWKCLSFKCLNELASVRNSSHHVLSPRRSEIWLVRGKERVANGTNHGVLFYANQNERWRCFMLTT